MNMALGCAGQLAMKTAGPPHPPLSPGRGQGGPKGQPRVRGPSSWPLPSPTAEVQSPYETDYAMDAGRCDDLWHAYGLQAARASHGKKAAFNGDRRAVDEFAV